MQTLAYIVWEGRGRGVMNVYVPEHVYEYMCVHMYLYVKAGGQCQVSSPIALHLILFVIFYLLYVCMRAHMILPTLYLIF